jgi:4-aminobutyrate aminotransferase/(S)-3-amino-2-methylpropionate transaminase
VAAAARRGLLILPCGVRGNVIRFMPALPITDDLISEGLDILGACLVEAEE